MAGRTHRHRPGAAAGDDDGRVGPLADGDAVAAYAWAGSGV